MDLSTKLLLAAAATGVVVLTASSSSSADDSGGNDVGKVSDKVRIWRKLEWINDLTDVQRYFLMLTAYGEGKYHPGAHNDSASERAASIKALSNNPTTAAHAQACGIDLDKLKTGSWTTFQLLAPYVTRTAFDIFGGAACQFADPTRAPQNLNLQIAIAIEWARHLQDKYPGFQARPTVGNLRLGWAAPAWMGYEHEHQDRIDKYKAAAVHEKFPDGLIDMTITRFPTNTAQIYEILRSSGPP